MTTLTPEQRDRRADLLAYLRTVRPTEAGIEAMLDAYVTALLATAEPGEAGPQDDVARLRQQNHDAAVRHDREVAALRSKVARYQNAYERARELVAGSPALGPENSADDR
jgi:glycine cleavage system protein P-like pyridoxal-binding family